MQGVRIAFAWVSFATAFAAGCSNGEVPGVYGPLGDLAGLPVDERIVVEHLERPVDVVRDDYGRPHIYASDIADAARVEG
jgi:acyl-homoserine lactone acylase PvdQ